MSGLVERVVGDPGDKRRWREYRGRAKALPGAHRASVEALERYLLHRGAITRGDLLVALHEELVEAFERAAADGVGVRRVVGADPVRYAEGLLGRYAEGEWIEKERHRLVEAITRAEQRVGIRP